MTIRTEIIQDVPRYRSTINDRSNDIYKIWLYEINNKKKEMLIAQDCILQFNLILYLFKMQKFTNRYMYMDYVPIRINNMCVVTE